MNYNWKKNRIWILRCIIASLVVITCACSFLLSFHTTVDGFALNDGDVGSITVRRQRSSFHPETTMPVVEPIPSSSAAGVQRWCPDINVNGFNSYETTTSNTRDAPFWTVELLPVDNSTLEVDNNNNNNSTGSDISNTKAWYWHYHPATAGLVHGDQNNIANTSPPRHTISVPAVGPFPKRGLDEILINATSYTHQKNMSVVFYGSSHLREFHMALLRMKRGQKYNEQVEQVVRTVPSGWNQTTRTLACDPGGRGWLGGEYGVDLENCGPPGKRVVTELSDANQTIRVGIGFKAFLHTPDAEDVFVEWLTQQHLRHPTVLVVDLGIWGVRGRKGLQKNKTLAPKPNRPIPPPKRVYPRTSMWLDKEAEVDYYFNWTQKTFPKSKIVWVYEDPDSPGSPLHKVDAMIFSKLQNITQQRQLAIENPNNKLDYFEEQDSVVLRKDLIRRNMPEGMPCDHGCGGPVTMVMATLLLDWLVTATTGAERCI